MNTFSTRTRRGAAILFSGVLVLGGLTLSGEATAGQEIEGNPTCAGLGYTYTFKVESPSAGTYTVDRDGMTARLTVGTHPDQADPNRNNAIVDHDISRSAAGYAVVVKGGNGATVYRSDTHGSLEGPPLHAPAVASGKWPTISHFQLCWNEPAPPPERGRIEVTKMVAGEGAPTADEYEICLTGPAPSTDEQCTTITGQGTATFVGLAPGTYEVTESNPGPKYEATITDATVQVTIGDVATATVTNEFVGQESLSPTIPETPSVPEVPSVPGVPTAPAAPTDLASDASLPATGSESGIAVLATILVATGVALTLLSRPRTPRRLER